MKKKTKPKTKRTPQNAELINKIKAVMLDGSGIRRRIEANLALPVKYPRDDGVFFDPKWQDDII